MPLDSSALHRLIEACLRDRMRAKPYSVDQAVIRRCVGLEPLPPRTDLAIERGDSLPCGSFERRLFSFESVPGVRVPVTAYVPGNAGPHPLALLAADRWIDGRRAPWSQAMGISLAMQGVLTVMIDPPGFADRSPMGSYADPALACSKPVSGVYVWDLMRTIDFATAALSALGEKVVVIGAGTGGSAALLLAAIDPRVKALVLCGAGHTQESATDEAYRELPGVAEVGDWTNLIAHRTDLPILFLTGEEDAPDRVEVTAKKVRAGYSKAAQALVRTERFLGGRDFNRRMREAAAAFTLTHLTGAPAKAYVPEPIPMTDGLFNSVSANTEVPDSLSMMVPSLSLQDLGAAALSEPYPEQDVDLIPWGKYGRLEPIAEMDCLKLVDHGESPNVVALPHVDAELLVPLGLSTPDFYAQLLHLLLPGAPEGWEPLGLQGDALTAMIASVRTLMKGAEPKNPPKRVEAEGPVASLTVRLLKQFRPQLEIEVTHEPSSWAEIVSQGIVVPGARYRRWPFRNELTGNQPMLEATEAEPEWPPAETD